MRSCICAIALRRITRNRTHPSRSRSLYHESIAVTFLKTTAAAGAAARAMTMDAKSYAQVPGANERIGIAFLGVGGRCQQHIDVILALPAANASSVRPVAVCDVWDGDAQLGRGTAAAACIPRPAALRPERDDRQPRHQGLSPAARPARRRRRLHRHAGPLARQDVASTPPPPASTSTAKSR